MSVADYVLWVRTQMIGAGAYRTVVAASPYEAVLRIEDPGNVAFVSGSAEAAGERARAELERLGTRLRADGHRIVDVVFDDQDPFAEERRLR
jgi:hypothetical protein